MKTQQVRKIEAAKLGRLRGGVALLVACLPLFFVVSAFGQAPTITPPSGVSGLEDSAGIYLFPEANRVTAPESDTMEAVVTLTAGNGQLTTGVVSASSLSSQGNRSNINAFLEDLRFVPEANWSGTATFLVEIERDYNARGDLTTFSFDVAVAAVNDAPVGTVGSVSTAEDTPKTLVAGDFGFTDPVDDPADTLAAVRIVTLPGNGSLTLNGGAVTANQEISAADLAANRLVFTPAANAFGAPYTSLTFRVRDDGGTDNSGVDLDTMARTLTLNVTPVNDAPVTEDGSNTVNKNGSLSFTLASSDVDSGTHATTDAKVSQYQIVTLPDNGTLSVSGSPVSAGDWINANTGDAARPSVAITFVPTTEFVGDASFTFKARDAANAESNTSTYTITVAPENAAPVVTVPGAQSMDEDTVLTLNGISFSDADAGSNRIRMDLSASNGTLTLATGANLFTDAAGMVALGATTAGSFTVYGTLANLNAAVAGLQYTPTANYFGGGTVSVGINDLGFSDGADNDNPKSDSDSIAVTVANVADAPVTGAAALVAVNEDTLAPSGATVASLLSNYSDVDSDALAGIAIGADASAAGEGIWQYSVNSGATWQAVGSVSSTTALLLNSSTRLRFLPVANYFGTPGALTIHAVDDSGSRNFTTSTRQTLDLDAASGATDVDAAGNTLTTSINAVNDVFTVQLSKALVVNEGETVLLTNAILQITDIEATAAQIVYTLVESGSILGDGAFERYNGSAWVSLAFGETFTQADINANAIRYVHGGAEPLGTEKLAYSVTDLLPEAGGTSANRTLTLSVTPVNDVPELYVPGDTVPGEGSALTAAIYVEDTEFVFTDTAVRVIDADNTDEQLVFRLESLPTVGELRIAGRRVAVGGIVSYARLLAGDLVYLYEVEAPDTDSFSVTVRDGSGGVVSETTLNISIDYTNIRPAGAGNLTATETVYEDPESYGVLASNDGAQLSDYSGFNFVDADPDASVGGYAIVRNNANSGTHGAWQYKVGGGSWRNVGGVNNTNTMLVLSPSTLVRFNPATDYNGTPPVLEFRVLDNTYAEAFTTDASPEYLSEAARTSSAIANTVNTVTVSITPVNDDPVLAQNNQLWASSSAGGSTHTITSAYLSASDVDSPASQLTFTLTALPASGEVRRNGSALGINGTFTQADIDGGLLSYYLPETSDLGTQQFSFTVVDGDYHSLLERDGGIYSGDNVAQVTFTIWVNNTAPNGIGDLTGAIWEDPTSYGALSNNDGKAISAYTGYAFSDPDAGQTAGGFALVSNAANEGSEGAWQYSTDGGSSWQAVGSVNNDTLMLVLPADAWARFVPVQDYNGTPPSLGMRVLDNTYSGSYSASTSEAARVYLNATTRASTTIAAANNTLTIVVNAVNDDPYVNRNDGYNMEFDTAPASITLGPGGLQVRDVDNAATTITFTLTSVPSTGELRLNDTALSVGQTFTQDDIDKNRLSYHLDEFLSSTARSFSYTVSGAGTHEVYVRDSGIYSGESLQTPTTTIYINPAPGMTYNNPTIDTNVGITLDEGTSAALANTNLLASQSNSAEQWTDATSLFYQLLSAPTHGTLRKSGTTLDAGDSFTHDDVNEGRISYLHDGGEHHSDSFDFQVTANSRSSGSATFAIDVTPVNDQPSFAINDEEELVIAEGSHAVMDAWIVADPLTGVFDLDGSFDKAGQEPLVPYADANVLSLYVSVLPLHGTMRLVDGGEAYDSADAETYTAVTTETAVPLTALDRLVYQNNGDEDAEDSITFVLNDNTGAANAESAPQTLGLYITPENDDPVIAVNAGRDVYEGATVVIDESFLLGTDPDNTDTQIQFRVVAAPVHGVLIRDDGTPVVLGVGSAFTVDDIRNDRFFYQHDGSESLGDSFQIRLSDGGGGNEPSATFALTVLAVNDAPEITVPAARIATEDLALTINGIVVADADAGSETLSLSVSVAQGVVTLATTDGLTLSSGSSGTGAMTYTGILSAINAALSGMAYQGDAYYNGSDTLSITVNDQGNSGTDADTLLAFGLSGDGVEGSESSTATLAITVQSVNNPPVIAVPSAQSVDEDAALVFSTANANAIAVSDIDAGSNAIRMSFGVTRGTLTLSSTAGLSFVSGSNGQSGFTVSGSQSALTIALGAGLTYQPGLDFFGSDTLAITANDQGHTGALGGTGTDSQSITITVNPVNDTPTVSGINRNATEDTTHTFSLASADADSDTNATTDAIVDRYRIVTLPTKGTLRTSADAAIDSADTLITVAQATNMKFVPGANENGSDSFTFRAVDEADAESVEATVTFTIAAVNDAPVLAGTSDTVSFTEGAGAGTLGTAVVLNASANLAITDVEITERIEDHFNGARVYAVRSGGAVSTDRYGISEAGLVTVSGSTVSYDGTAIGTSSGTSNFYVTFNSSATKAGVDAVMRRITFNSVADNLNESVTVRVYFNDGNGDVAQGSGGALNSNNILFTVNIANTNNPPSFTSAATLTVAEGAANPTGVSVSALLSARFSDADTPLDGSTFTGIAITADAANPTTEGEWQYSVDAGDTWLPVTVEESGPNAAQSLLLDTTTLLRFVPVANFNSTFNRATAHPGALSVLPIDDSVVTTYTDGSTRQLVDTQALSDTSQIGTTGTTVTAIVTQVNSAPALNNLEGTAGTFLAFTEAVGVNVAGAAVLLSSLNEETDPSMVDMELTIRNETTFNGSRIVVGAAPLDTNDLIVVQNGFGISVQGASALLGSGVRVYNNGSAILYDNVVVATLTQNSRTTGQLIVTFNTDADAAAVNAVLKNLAFSNSSATLDTVVEKDIVVQFYDGNGSASNNQGTGGELSDDATIAIRLTPVNDSPTLANGANLTTIEDTTSTATTFTAMLATGFSDPDAIDGNTLIGVAISAFDNKGRGEWQVNLGTVETPDWVPLTTISGNVSGGISTTAALVLAADRQIRFVPAANANTETNGATSLKPTLSVHGIEELAPVGGGNPGPSDYTTSAASPVTWNTTTYVGESRVAVDPVTIDMQINARNDPPTLSASGSYETYTYTNGVFAGTLIESAVAGVGTPAVPLLMNAASGDLDLATTDTLGDTTFGEGAFVVTIADPQPGDSFSLAGMPLDGIRSMSGSGSSNFQINLAGTATLSQLNILLAALRYEHTSDVPPGVDNERSFTVWLYDGNNAQAGGDAGGPASLQTTISGTITIDSRNDPPELSATALNPTYIEDGSAVTVYSGADTTTIQTDQTLTELQLTVSGLSDGANELFTFAGSEITLTAGSYLSDQLTITLDGATATLVYVPSTPLTEAQMNTLIDGLAYRNSSQWPSTSNRIVTLTLLKDNGGEGEGIGDDTTTSADTGKLPSASTIAVVSVNDAPDLTATLSGTFTEGDAEALLIASAVSISDSDADHFMYGSLTVALDTYHSGDTLSIVPGGTVTVDGSTISVDSHGIATFSGGTESPLVISLVTFNATISRVAAIIERIGYSNTDANPTRAGTATTRAVTVTLNDGGNTGSASNPLSDAASGTLNVTGINDAPTLTNLDATSANMHIQGGSAVVIDSNATLGDADLAALPFNGSADPYNADGNWAGSTLTVQRWSGSEPAPSTDDLFTGSNISAASGNVIVSSTTIGSYTRADGVLTITFNADATTALVQEALRSLRYANAVTTPGALAYNSLTLRYTFNDQNSNDTGGGSAGSGQDQGNGGASSVSGDIVVNINRLPVLAADTASVDEGIATTDDSTVSGNVLTDAPADSDPDGDSLSVIGYVAGTEAGIHNNGIDAARAGNYGSVTIAANGNFTYTLDNTLAAVQALAHGETLTDVFSYSASDDRSGFGTTTVTITVNGTNDAPLFTLETGDSAVASIAESNTANLSASDTLTLSDVDTSNTVSTAVVSVTASGNGNIGGKVPDNATLLAMLSLSNAAIANDATSTTLTWNFDSGETTFEYLASGESLVLTYVLRATDDGTHTPDATADQNVVITITGGNRTPQITATEVTGAVTEDTTSGEPSLLRDTGSIAFTDPDSSDTVTVSSAFVGTTTTGPAVPAGLTTALGSALSLSGDTSGENAGTVAWAFGLDTALVQYLAKDETVTVTYRLTTTDSSGITEASGEHQSDAATQDVTLTITGINDAPTIALVDDDSAMDTLTETNAALTSSGTLTVGDVDVSNTVTASRVLTSATGTTLGISDGDFLAMLTLEPAAILDAATTSAALTWNFNSGSTTFDGLRMGESMVLTYTVTVTDSNDPAATDTRDVVLTINGSNDVPVLTAAAPAAVAEAADASAQDLNLSGNLSIGDKDIGDTLTASKGDGVVAWSGGVLPGGVDLTALTAETALTFAGTATSDGGDVTIGWTYAPEAVDLDFLALGETVTVTWPVTVSDGQGGSDGDNLVITITGSSDAPEIALGDGNSDAVAIAETNAGLTGSGTLGVVDLDYKNTVSGSVASLAVSGTTAGIGVSEETLLGYLTVTPNVIGNAATTGTLTWSFDSGAEAFDYLAVGESLVLEYLVRVTDTNGATDEQTVTVTITGANDAPAIAVGSGNSAAETIAETGSGNLSTSGSLSVADLDYSNTVTAAKTTVVAGGKTDGLGSDNAALLAMLSLSDNDPVIGATSTSGTLNWAFDSGTEAFLYLAADESLTLTYTVEATDSNDPVVTDTQEVVVTITGINNAPGITIGVMSADLVEDDTDDVIEGNLTASGSLSYTDSDLTDTSTVTREFVSAEFTSDRGDGKTPEVSAELLAALNLMDAEENPLAADAGALRISGDGVSTPALSGTVDWEFVLDNTLVQYLAAGEVVTVKYNIIVTDGESGSDSEEVTITLAGVNDGPTVSVGDGNVASAGLTETDAGLTATGTVTVADVDATDAVEAVVVQTLGKAGDANGITDETLLGMLSVDPAAILAAGGTTAQLAWEFDSDGEAFDYLQKDETLALTYTIQVSDDHAQPGATETQAVVITLTGSNDVPVLAITAPDAVAEAADASAQDLSLAGDLSIGDKDVGDTLTASKGEGVVSWSGGVLPVGVDLTALTAGTALTFGDDVVSDGGDVTIGWTYNPDAVNLDFLAVGETLTVTWPVTVSDGQGGSDVEDLVITITGSSDAPAIAVGDGNSDAVAIPETNAGLTGSGTLGVVDLDYKNTVSGAVASLAVSGTTAGIGVSEETLEGYLTVTLNVIGNDATSGTLTWSFNSGAEAFDYLAHDESLVLAYTVRASDGNGAFDEQTVTVTINGSNDAPVIVVDSGDKASDSLTESGSALTSSGTLSVADVDYSNTVGGTVHAVEATGTTTGLGSNNDALLAMFSLISGNPVIANTATDGSIAWSFDSGSELFGHLGSGETLTLTYTIRVTDAGAHAPAATDDQTVTFTISGSNNAPVITASDVAGAVEEDNLDDINVDGDLTTTGSISFSDEDTSDTSTVTRSFVSANVTTQLPDKEAVVSEALLAALNLSDGSGGTLGAEAGAMRISGAGAGSAANNGDVTWDFVLDNALVQYLAAGEVVTASYSIDVNDGTETTSQAVTVTITGVNDTPAVTLETGDSASADLTETNVALSDSGTVTVGDADLTDTVTAAEVASVSYDGDRDNLTDQDLLGMFSITPEAILDDETSLAQLTWNFASTPETFDHLRETETLAITYTIRVTDNGAEPGASSDREVVVTITGSNDAPSLATIDAPEAVAEGLDGSAQSVGPLSADLSVTDIDTGDTLVGEKGVAALVWSGGEVPVDYDLSGLIADAALTLESSVTTDGGTVGLSWTYDPAAVNLDFLNPEETLTVTWPVTVSDGTTSSNSENLVITITASNDAPVISAVAGTELETLTEADAGLATTDSFSVVDLDYTDTVSGSVQSVVKSGTVAGIPYLDATLKGYLSVTETIIGNTATSGTLAWGFDSGAATFDYLAAGESVELAYTVRASDGNGAFDEQTVTVTINGSNDAPAIAVADGDSAAEGLTETGSALSTNGTLSVSDSDYSNTVAATVESVVASGVTDGLISDNTALLAMLSLTNDDPVITATSTDGSIAWSFASGSEVFAHLGGGEELVLTYTVRATDSNATAATDEQTVTFTISGSNNPPVITATDVAGAVVEDTTSGDPLMLRDNGAISFSDADTSDTSVVTRSFVSAEVTTQLEGKTTTVSEALLAALNLLDAEDQLLAADAGALRIGGAGVGSAANNGDVTWDFVLDNALVQYLAAGEVVTAVYRLQVNDGDTTTNQEVTVTLTGVNDVPDLTPGVVSAELSEGRDLDAGNLVASGSVDFADTDATDRVQASVAVKSVTLGSAATPSVALSNALNAAVTLSGDGEGAGANSGTTGWTFALDNDLVRALPVGEVLTAVYTLTFTDDAAGTTTQDVSIEIRPRVATQLVVTEIPQQAAGVGFAVEVTLADELGAPILNTGAAADITLSLKAGNGTLGGTLVGTLAVGESSLTLSGVTYTLAEEDVQLTATAAGDGARADGLTGDSNEFDVIAGPAVRVALTGPASVVAGVASGAITATTYDQHDNVAPVSAETAFSLASDEQAGTATFAPASGVFKIAAGASSATFTYTNTKVGTGTHVLTANRTSGDAVGSDTHNIAVIPAAAMRVALTGPESAVAGEASEAITLTTYDSYDNVAPVTADTTFSLASSEEVATATFDPESESLQIDAGSSSATFTYTNTQVGTGAHTLTVARASGDAVGSDTHAIAIVPAAAVSVSLTGPASVVAGETSGAFTATTYDTYGNVAPVSAETVFNLSSAEQGATAVFDPASETFAIAADASSATFTYSNQKVGSGSHTITAARSSGDEVGSDDHLIVVNPAVPAKIALTGPTDIIAGITTATMTVTTLDTYDNPSPVSQNTTFTLSTDQATPSASFAPASGDFTVAGGSSSAQFVYGNTMVGSGLHRLTATRASGDAVGSDSYDLTVFSGVPTKLVFVTQPAEISTAGEAFPRQPVVRFEDDYGNVIINADVPITLTLSTGTGTLSGTVSVDAVSGVATFDGLSIDLAGSDKILTASATFITEESESIDLEQASDTFRIRPSALKRIVILTQPQETVAGTMVVGHPTVQLQDEFENPLEVPHRVTIELIGAELHPSSVITVNSDEQGIAVFDELRIDQAGTDYTIRFTATPIID